MIIAGGLLAATALTGLIGPAVAQSVSDYPAQTVYPDQDREAVSKHLQRAYELAGEDLWSEMRWRCLISPLDTPRVRGVQHDGLVPATQVFDEVYSVGQNSVSAYAIKTSEGIILIDALNNTEEAEQIIVPNLEAMGLDPADIKYVVVSHGHGDHYGGAKYFQDTYGARIIASAADWDIMRPEGEEPNPDRVLPPERDMIMEDGGELTLGDFTMQFYVMPGHTPGTLAMIFPVQHNGETHVAGFHSGSGGSGNPAAARSHVNSIELWADITSAAGVDVLLTNHPAHSDVHERQFLLRYDATGGVNPFVYGEEKFQRFWQIMSECSKMRLAQLGEPVEE